jgi:hypothetical protein
MLRGARRHQSPRYKLLILLIFFSTIRPEHGAALGLFLEALAGP